MNDGKKQEPKLNMFDPANDDGGPAAKPDDATRNEPDHNGRIEPENDVQPEEPGEFDEFDDVDDLDREAELEAQVSDLTDRLLRAVADTENLRKRAEREREDARKYAVTKFAEDMLGVADNMARALDAVDDELRQNDAVKGLVEGVDLTAKELATVLDRHGIKQIDPMGEKFDHNLHQAMFEVEDADAEPGTVVQVLRTGYTIGDRLLRPAMVGVAKKPA